MLGFGVGHEGLLLEEELLVSAKEMGEGWSWFRLGGVGFEWVRTKVRMFLRARESWLVFHVGDPPELHVYPGKEAAYRRCGARGWLRVTVPHCRGREWPTKTGESRLLEW